MITLSVTAVQITHLPHMVKHKRYWTRLIPVVGRSFSLWAPDDMNSYIRHVRVHFGNKDSLTRTLYSLSGQFFQ